MAAEFLPTDEYTGIPLAIYPSVVGGREDDHHAFFEHEDWRLQGLGGKAIRHCRLQRVKRTLHERYHDFYREHERPLPTNDIDRFFVTIWAIADYLPRTAVDVSGSAPIFRQLDDSTYQYIRSHKLRQQRGTAWSTGVFLMNVVLGQNLDHVRDTHVDEFLHTPHPRRRRALGHLLIAEAIRVGVEPIEAPYRKAWRDRLIAPRRPDDPVACVQQAFNGHTADYFDMLTMRLTTSVA